MTPLREGGKVAVRSARPVHESLRRPDASPLPLGIFEGFPSQRLLGRPVDLIQQVAPRAADPAVGTGVQLGRKIGDPHSRGTTETSCIWRRQGVPTGGPEAQAGQAATRPCAPQLSCPPPRANARDCVRMRFFCCGVDVALMLVGRMQEAPLGALRISLILL